MYLTCNVCNGDLEKVKICIANHTEFNTILKCKNCGELFRLIQTNEEEINKMVCRG